MSFTSMYRNFQFGGRAGVTEGPEDEDYENMDPSKEDHPPRPGTRKFPHPGGRLGWLRGSIAPPRPPRAGKKTVKPELPSKSPQAAGLELGIIPCPTPPQMGLHLNSPNCLPPQRAFPNPPTIQEYHPCQLPQPSQEFHPSQLPQPSQVFQHSQGLQFTQVPQLNQGLQLSQVLEPRQKRKIPQLTRKERMAVCFCMLVVIALLLGVTSLAVTLLKYQMIVEELRMARFQQIEWITNVTARNGLAGLRKDIDQIRIDIKRNITEIKNLIECIRKSCPKNWLPFGESCYFFSKTTKTWDAANMFCMENLSHLVIISGIEEQLCKGTKGGNHWLMTGTCKPFDENLSWSPRILGLWKPGEPNNSHNEDCAVMISDGKWNDISCNVYTYWICERKLNC